MGEETIGRCWHCGGDLTRLDYGRESECPACGKQTHCCRNCRHYAPGRANECMEPLVERVIEKTRANFCELFEPSGEAGPGTPAPQAGADTDALRQAAEALFKS